MSCRIQNASRNKQQQQSRITQMITAVAGIFLICNTCTLMCYAYVSKNEFAYSGMGDSRHGIINLIGVLFVLISTSIKAVIYRKFNKKYRKMFLKYFCLRRCKEGNNFNTSSKTNPTNIKLTEVSAGKNVPKTLE